MGKKLDITFKIVDIRTLKFLINNIAEAYKADKSEFEFNISAATFSDASLKTISINILIDVYTDKTRQHKVSELITQMVYEIVNFDEVVKIDSVKNTLEIPDNFVTTLFSIALSTSRGIFAAKTEGSALSGAFLPVLNPAAFKPVAIIPQPKKK